MAASLRSALRETGKDAAVEVNQRALIDKVLARYSGDLTPFRELLQNADDATASLVQITFHSKQPQLAKDALSTNSSNAYRPNFDLGSHITTGFTVKNDGQVFSESDWARIRKIAEGNPDESKIGAFGVGAYSLFSLCEEPIISSGSQAVLFHWGASNGDQLFVKQGPNPNAATDISPDGKPWTTFEISSREQGPIPDVMHFCQFLCNSLAFTSNLARIQLFLDDFCLCDLAKTLAPPIPIMPSSSLSLTSPKRTMSVTSVQYAGFQLNARVLGIVLKAEEAKVRSRAQPRVLNTATKFLQNAFSLAMSQPSSSQNTELSNPNASAIINISQTYTSSIFLRIANANVSVSLNRRQVDELERATKKKPPSRTVFQMIYSSKDERDASDTNEQTTAIDPSLVFSGLQCTPEKQGRLAIGFMTHQTSGCAASIAGRFIPTVERESLDLQNGHVAEWNKELLSIGGILARIIYEDEVVLLGRRWSTADGDARTKLVDSFNHLARFFSYQPSTPASLVAEMCEASFFSAAKRSNEISVLTTDGAMVSTKARLPDAELQVFLRSMATLHTSTVEIAPIFVSQLHQRALLKEISMQDILQELGSRPLSMDEMRSCLAWWIKLSSSDQHVSDATSKIMNAAILQASDDDILPLFSVQRFLGQRSLLHDFQPPPNTLPYGLSRHFKQTDLSRIFGWSEMVTPDEVRYLLSPKFTGASASAETNMLLNARFSERILVNVAKIWGTLSNASQTSVTNIFRENPVIPTKKGLQKASDSYFENVSLFDDLCIIAFNEPVRGNLEKVLSQSGVLRHVDLQVIFTRLFSAGNWSHYDLIKYLVSVQSTLTDEEYKRLRKTAWLPCEKGPNTVGGNRQTADALLEPLHTFRTLTLPIVEWPVKWLASSPEAKFLFKIGLRRHPSVTSLLRAASNSSDAEIRKQALSYYLNNFDANGYAIWTAQDHEIAFVPAQKPDGAAILSKPADCYAQVGAAELGFTVINASLQAEAHKLKVQLSPPTTGLLTALLNSPPRTEAKATAIFTYLSTRLADFGPTQWKSLRQSDFIPIFDTVNGQPQQLKRIIKPSTCYFRKSDQQTSPLYASIFTFVDFGQGAKPFLSASGVQEEPTSAEVARLLVSNPHQLFHLAKTPEAYLDLLRSIATASRQMPASLLKAMRTAPILLTYIRVAQTSSSQTGSLLDIEDEDESEPLLRHQLKSPSETVVIDDVNLWRLFGDVVYSCPQEDVLEAFAEELGALRISAIVKDTHRVSGQQQHGHTGRSQELSSLIVERAALFLHERQQGSSNEVRRSAEWLKQHLRVVEASKLELHRALTYNNQRHTKVLPTTAVATQEGPHLVLYILRTDEPDWFEVASTLTKHILVRQRVNDALLFMTLLSTTLKTLQRRGFDTSRILSARKREQQVQAEKQRQAELSRDLEKSHKVRQDQVAKDTAKLKEMFPDADSEHLHSLIKGNDPDEVQRAAESMMSGSYPREPQQPPSPMLPAQQQQRTSTLFNNFKRKFGYSKLPDGSGSTTGPDTSRGVEQMAPPPAQTQLQQRPLIPPQDSRVTPMNDIRENCLRAIQASRPDRSNAIQNQSEFRQVKESQASYCDPTSAADLTYVTDIEQLRFYVASGVEPQLILAQHGDALRRMVSKIIVPIGQVFRLDPRALHIFCDVAGPLIAFNRNGSLFINLRFYLQWHDTDVANNQINDCLISNYFTLAHELAHNLCANHDAQHGFYTSSIGETFLQRFFAILQV